MTEDMLVVYGPVAPADSGRMIYSITLANGHVVTSPDGFADYPVERRPVLVQPLPVVPEDIGAGEFRQV